MQVGEDEPRSERGSFRKKSFHQEPSIPPPRFVNNSTSSEDELASEDDDQEPTPKEQNNTISPQSPSDISLGGSPTKSNDANALSPSDSTHSTLPRSPVPPKRSLSVHHQTDHVIDFQSQENHDDIDDEDPDHSTDSSLSSVPDESPERSLSPAPSESRKRKRNSKGRDHAIDMGVKIKSIKSGGLIARNEDGLGGREDEDEEEEEEDDEEEDEEDEEEEDRTITVNTGEDEEVEGHNDDDDEYHKKHKEALQILTEIEIDFAKLRDKMYHEKISELDEEVVMINNGSHPELAALMAEIKLKRQKRQETAAAWKKHQEWGFQKDFEGAQYQAHVHFVTKRNALRREMIGNLNTKRWMLEDERNKLNDLAPISTALPDRSTLTRHRKFLKSEVEQLKTTQETLGFPCAPSVLGLSKNDVNEDLESLGLARIPPTLPRPQKTGNNIPKSDRRSSTSSTTEVIINIQTNKLRYNDQWFKKGDYLSVVDVSGAGKYTAKLHSTNETEIVIQRMDGSKTRLQMNQIKEGKYRLEAKT